MRAVRGGDPAAQARQQQLSVMRRPPGHIAIRQPGSAQALPDSVMLPAANDAQAAAVSVPPATLGRQPRQNPVVPTLTVVGTWRLGRERQFSLAHRR